MKRGTITSVGNPAHSRELPALRGWLREATREGHRDLDATMSALDLSTRAGYGTFLRIHIEAMQYPRMVYRPEDQPDIANLIRCAACDLASLGVARMPASHALQWRDEARAWGMGYVIRGSRLGAEVLRRRVPRGLPSSFLDYATQLRWPDFVAQLDAFGAQGGVGARNEALAGAELAFEIYRQISARSVPAAIRSCSDQWAFADGG